MHDMLGAARVDQLDADARIQEGELAIAVLELLEIELDDVLERLGRGLKGDARALLARGRGAADDERGDRIAMLEAHPMRFAVPPHRQLPAFPRHVAPRNTEAVHDPRPTLGQQTSRERM